MNTEQHQVVLNDHKDILIYQFRLLNDYSPQDKQAVLGYLSYMWQLNLEQQLQLDTFGGTYRYVMYSGITNERYTFLVTMDAIQRTMSSIQFEGLLSSPELQSGEAHLARSNAS